MRPDSPTCGEVTCTAEQNVIVATVNNMAGQVAHSSNISGQTTSSCYDGLGLVVKSMINPSAANPCADFTPSASTDQDIITIYSYDAAGNRADVTDADGKTTDYTYDGLNWELSVTGPLGRVTTTTYDLLSNRTDVLDARGVVTHFENNARNRLITVIENDRPGSPVNAETNVTTRYTYDALGNRLTQTQPAGNTTYTYDDANRLVTANGVEYTCDDDGNMLSDGNLMYSYDTSNRLVIV